MLFLLLLGDSNSELPRGNEAYALKRINGDSLLESFGVVVYLKLSNLRELLLLVKLNLVLFYSETFISETTGGCGYSSCSVSLITVVHD